LDNNIPLSKRIPYTRYFENIKQRCLLSSPLFQKEHNLFNIPTMEDAYRKAMPNQTKNNWGKKSYSIRQEIMTLTKK
jgi:hypothetical protein